jgi:hypothetical protein
MIKEFEKLTMEERALLLQAPALVSVLAASGDQAIDKAGKADAIKLAHLKIVTADAALLPYYKEVHINFKRHFEAIVKRYAPFDDRKRGALRREIESLNPIIAKLDTEFAKSLHASLARYEEHVKKAEGSVLVDFIFPLPIPGLSE